MSACGCEFNRSLQHSPEISLLVFRILMFFLGVRSTAAKPDTIWTKQTKQDDASALHAYGNFGDTTEPGPKNTMSPNTPLVNYLELENVNPHSLLVVLSFA